MKLFKWIVIAVAMGGVIASNAAAALVGYYNQTFQVGDNWFGNQLNTTNNLLSAIIPTAPAGTTVSLWDSAAHTYSPGSTWNGTKWSADFLLNPGMGALLHTVLVQRE